VERNIVEELYSVPIPIRGREHLLHRMSHAWCTVTPAPLVDTARIQIAGTGGACALPAFLVFQLILMQRGGLLDAVRDANFTACSEACAGRNPTVCQGRIDRDCWSAGRMLQFSVTQEDGTGP
jgi:hypothetical protein